MPLFQEFHASLLTAHPCLRVVDGRHAAQVGKVRNEIVTLGCFCVPADSKEAGRNHSGRGQV